MNTPPRHHSHTRKLLAAAALAIPPMLTGPGLSAPPAQAGYIMSLAEVGTSVVAAGSGTIDLADLTPLGLHVGLPLVEPNAAIIYTGGAFYQANDGYAGLIGPTNFGTGGQTFASDSGPGQSGFVGIAGAVGFLAVPAFYISNNPLSSDTIWDNASLTSLGVTPGIYTWTWGTGVHADSFTLEVEAVPAPLIGHGLPVLLAVGGLLFGAKLWERGKGRRLQFG